MGSNKIITIYENQDYPTSINVFYVIEGKDLVPISKYAISYEDEFNDCSSVKYKLDYDKIKDKKILWVRSSSRGYMSARIIDPRMLDNPLMFSEPSMLPNGIHISIEDVLSKYNLPPYPESLRVYVDYWRNQIRPMVKEILSFFEKYNIYASTYEHVENFLRDIDYPPIVLLSCVKDPEDVLWRSYHDLYVTWLIIKILKESKDFTTFMSPSDLDRRSLNLIFGGFISLFLGESSGKPYSLHSKFLFDPEIAVEGYYRYEVSHKMMKKWYNRVDPKIRYDLDPLFIDLVIFEGEVLSEEDLENDVKIETLIMASYNGDFSFLSKYPSSFSIMRTLEPKELLFISMTKINESFVPKEGRIIEEVYPGGKGEKEFVEYLRSL
ncbi:MAG: hypothetical protein OWQ54_05200 [Sulfolobaceae archaeon]|nr:hypothetical protein [Sulfolobaceae archaeon]